MATRALEWRPELFTTDCPVGAKLSLHTSCGQLRTYAVARGALQRAVFADISVNVLCHPNGDLYPFPKGMDDELLDEMHTKGRFSGTPIDVAIKRSFALLINEPNPDALADLTQLHERLVSATKAVEEQMAKRRRALTEPSNDSSARPHQ